MPQPYPGQDWKHGWIPVTAKAIRQKNHGRTPGPDSELGRQMARASGSSGGTPSAVMDAAIRSRAARNRTRTITTGTASPTRPARNTSPRTPEIPAVRQQAERLEQRNPFGANTIARDPNNISPGQSVYMGDGWGQVTSFQRRYRQDGVNIQRPGMAPTWYPLNQIQGYVRNHNEALNMPPRRR